MKSIEKEEKKGSDRGVPFYKNQDDLKTILYSEIEVNNEKYSAADICFVCDVTGSMEPHIDLIKEILGDFVGTVHKLINTHPRVSVIGFRDKNDAKQIEFKDFTTDPAEIVEFLEGIECKGGGDDCEDLITPLKKLLTLNWKSDLIYVYLLLDAPTHGKSYHGVLDDDDFPEDDNERVLEKLVYHLMSCRINLVIFKCNDSVDIMISKIREYYDTDLNKLRVIDIPNKEMLKKDFAKNFLVTVSKDISQSMANSQYRNFRLVKQKRYTAKAVEDIDMNSMRPFDGTLYTGAIDYLEFETKNYNYIISLTKTNAYECLVSGKKIGSGMFADCYPLTVDNSTNYVAKYPKFLIANIGELKGDIEANLITKYFAEKFNNFLAFVEMEEKKAGNKTFKALRIYVLTLVIIENITPVIPRKKFFLAQKLLSGDYIKYNNNYGWTNTKIKEESSCLLAQAFSHFTYEYSMGTMMVVDIQGTTNKKGGLFITDPAIHSLLFKNRFGETNHGKIGIIRFFQTHKCNDYCKKLWLSDPKEVDKSRVEEVREKFVKEKGLGHLYEGLEERLERIKKQIENFRQQIEPNLDTIVEEPDIDDTSDVYL
eukprot:TRINITY_DN9735_c0_g2_i1.p1 TRINITY_DN9735_c0_g2~~TRINITY_DN9735_c0_g2_i1.p1  ORF type:complete len:596 (-),score=171.42 TRINITY_DN9735_c0_g2_i1:129-1916(-)